MRELQAKEAAAEEAEAAMLAKQSAEAELLRTRELKAKETAARLAAEEMAGKSAEMATELAASKAGQESEKAARLAAAGEAREAKRRAEAAEGEKAEVLLKVRQAEESAAEAERRAALAVEKSMAQERLLVQTRGAEEAAREQARKAQERESMSRERAEAAERAGEAAMAKVARAAASFASMERELAESKTKKEETDNLLASAKSERSKLADELARLEAERRAALEKERADWPERVRAELDLIEARLAASAFDTAADMIYNQLIEMCRKIVGEQPSSLDWPRLRSWLRTQRALHPGLDEAARLRLDRVDTHIREHTKHQYAWEDLRNSLMGPVSDEKQISRVNDFIRVSYGSPYRPAAEALHLRISDRVTRRNRGR